METAPYGGTGPKGFALNHVFPLSAHAPKKPQSPGKSALLTACKKMSLAFFIHYQKGMLPHFMRQHALLVPRLGQGGSMPRVAY